MSVVLSIKEIGPCRKQLTVEIPAPAVEAETRRVIGELRRRVRLPGFRRGKVPSELIRQKFRSDIEKQVVDRLLPRYWRQAEAEAELQALLPPSVEEVDFRPGAELTFVASVDIRPEIEVDQLADFELPEIGIEPSEDEVGRAIEELRRAVVDWVEVDRPAARGDRVTAELAEQPRGGESPPEPKTVSFEVGDPEVWEEVSLAVTGKRAGQSEEFERRVEEEGEGTRSYRISVSSVNEPPSSPLDDELAAKIGDFESVAALREDVRQRLVRAKRLDRRQKRERALLEQLRERYPTELPKGVIDHEIEGMLREYAQNLADSGVDLERAEIDWRALGEQLRPQAERRVHARLLLDAAAEKLSVQIAEDEFETTLASLARAQGRTTTAVRQELDGAGRLAELKQRMRRDKTLRLLLGEEPAAVGGSPEMAAENQPAPTD